MARQVKNKGKKKDKWDRDKIDKKVAYDVVDRIRKADPDSGTVETVIMGYVHRFNQNIKYGDIWMTRDWDALSKYVDRLENNAILVALVDALYDVLSLAALKADNLKRHQEVKERVKEIESNKKSKRG